MNEFENVLKNSFQTAMSIKRYHTIPRCIHASLLKWLDILKIEIDKVYLVQEYQLDLMYSKIDSLKTKTDDNDELDDKIYSLSEKEQKDSEKASKTEFRDDDAIETQSSNSCISVCSDLFQLPILGKDEVIDTSTDSPVSPKTNAELASLGFLFFSSVYFVEIALDQLQEITNENLIVGISPTSASNKDIADACKSCKAAIILDFRNVTLVGDTWLNVLEEGVNGTKISGIILPKQSSLNNSTTKPNKWSCVVIDPDGLPQEEMEGIFAWLAKIRKESPLANLDILHPAQSTIDMIKKALLENDAASLTAMTYLLWEKNEFYMCFKYLSRAAFDLHNLHAKKLFGFLKF